MIFPINSEIIDVYKKSKNNINYMLKYLLSCIDIKTCKDCFNMFDHTSYKEKIIEVDIDIDVDNVKRIKSIFNRCDNKLVEQLLWVAVLFNEV